MRVILLVLGLSVLSVTGCTQPSFEEPLPEEGELFNASAMRIHPIFTQVKDWTGDGTADGIEVLLEFQDVFGDPTKAAGTVMFELHGYRPGNPEPKGQRLANPWIGSMTSYDEQRARWNRTSRTYTFQLAFPQVEKTRSYVLAAQFRATTGERLFGQAVLEGIPEQPTTRPTTKPIGGSIFGD